MRRSSASSGRSSLAPMRVKNDNGQNVRRTTGSSHRQSAVPRPWSSFGRQSFGRLSTGSSTGIPRASNIRGKGMGMGASQRRSSAYGKSRIGDSMKDPRKLSDRSLQHRMTKDIIEFLSMQGFPHQISQKLMSPPTTKLFTAIVQFLYGQFLDPSFQILKKFEEEIPRIFKDLRYPFPLSKSQMFTIGTPHTWPHILGALHWLLQLVKYSMRVDGDKLMFNEDFESNSENKILFEYSSEAYKCFLEGNDDMMSQYDQRMEDELRASGIKAEDLQTLATENMKLQEELEQLEKQEDPLIAATTLRDQLKEDAKQLQDHLEKVEHQKSGLVQNAAHLEEELQIKRQELETEQKENVRLQQIFDTQEFSPMDVELMNRQRQQLSVTLDDLNKEIERLEQQCWELEMKQSKQREQMQSVVQEYNMLARQLKLIPPTAENAHGMDYEMRLVFNAGSTANQVAMVDFVGTIKPALIQMRKQIADTCHSIEAARLTEEESLEQITDMINDKKEELGLMETRLRRIEEELDHKKEMMAREYKKHADEVQDVQNQLQEMRLTHQELEAKKDEAYKELQVSHQAAVAKVKEWEREETEYVDFLVHCVELVCAHQDKIQDHFSKLQAQAMATLQETQQIEVPTSQLLSNTDQQD
ncbi:kinetochore protein NDC80 homolog [Branchiostoma floridae]|uniref:Kinetochore protein NDC80 n=1 Tax=Branchiostoma floridae TaxID=7739 RepID=A0A9J7LNR2_BRAFL|nr:kinetochore protein NDC80 homolog [Branchiostoma floridae]